MWIYYLIFFIITIVAIIDFIFLVKDRNKNIRILIFTSLSIFLILFAGLRKLGVGVDDFNYYNIFLLAKKNIFHKELAFFAFSQLFNTITPVFFIFALLGVGIKCIYAKFNISYWGFALLFYFSSYFILHEMVQVRAGVAAALGLWSIYFSSKQNFTKFSITIILGLLFHYSILIFTPVYFLKKKNTRFRYTILFILSFITVFKQLISSSLIESIFPSFINERLTIFLDSNKAVNLFNPIIIINYSIIIFILIYWNTLANYSKQSIFIIKSYILAVCIQLIFNQFSGISFRLYELLMIVQIPLFDMFIKVVKPKVLIILFVFLYSFLIFYVSICYDPIILPYY